MKSLSIEDLSASIELNDRAMSAVRGGTPDRYSPPLFFYSPLRVADMGNFSAQQLVGQSSNVFNNTTAAGAQSTIVPIQNGTNAINFL